MRVIESYLPVFLTKVAADNPPGYVEAKASQLTIPARHPPMTPLMTPAAVALAQVMDMAMGTTEEAIRIPVK